MLFQHRRLLSDSAAIADIADIAAIADSAAIAGYVIALS